MDARMLFLKSGFNFRDIIFLFKAFEHAKSRQPKQETPRVFFDFVAKWGQEITGGITLFSGVFLTLIVVMAITGDIQGIPIMLCIYVILLFVCIWGMSYLNKCSFRLGIKLSFYYFRYKRIVKKSHSS